MVFLSAWSADPMASTMAVAYLVSIVSMSVADATLRDRYRWAPGACLALALLVVTSAGLLAGWEGFAWSASSRILKTVGLCIGLGLPMVASFVGVFLARRKGVAVRIVSGIALGGIAALVAPTVWLVAVCVLTGDCL